jgi:hypothetical protein
MSVLTHSAKVDLEQLKDVLLQNYILHAEQTLRAESHIQSVQCSVLNHKYHINRIIYSLILLHIHTILKPKINIVQIQLKCVLTGLEIFFVPTQLVHT